ncbi:MAG TPA: hypothetical protein VGH97_00860 [Thermoanaerobaculia bacterium]|jgi:hypothetical protein
MRNNSWRPFSGTLLFVAALGAAACHDAPTTPVAPSPPIPEVAGAWTGTVQSLDYGDEGPLCPSEPVSVDLESADAGSRFFHASIRAACVTANFSGQFVAPTNEVLNGTVTYDVGGVQYQAVLNATFEGKPSSRMTATTSSFQHPFPDGSVLLRDSLRLELSR